MVHEELPAWCAERGFDTGRLAAWGWSMGGYGALLLAETFAGFVRSVAAFSPAVAPGDAVFSGVARLAGTPIGLWCGRDDGLYADVRSLHDALPVEPAARGYGAGLRLLEHGHPIGVRVRWEHAPRLKGTPAGCTGEGPWRRAGTASGRWGTTAQ
jgi:dienelactone hydrolase